MSLALFLGEENNVIMELPKTEQELQELIDNAVNQATEKLVSKHNGEMANLRTNYEKKLKEKDLSAEELAKIKAEEMAQEKETELQELRTFKKTTILKDKVSKAGLPSYFVNDNRLLTAEEGDIDKTIKTIKNEYDASLPKGNTHSTVVNTNNGGPTPKNNGFEQVGQLLNDLVK